MYPLPTITMRDWDRLSHGSREGAGSGAQIVMSDSISYCLALPLLGPVLRR